MTQTKTELVLKYINERLEWLDALIYDHRCNIDEPDEQQMCDYCEAVGERDALRKIKKMIE